MIVVWVLIVHFTDGSKSTSLPYWYRTQDECGAEAAVQGIRSYKDVQAAICVPVKVPRK